MENSISTTKKEKDPIKLGNSPVLDSPIFKNSLTEEPIHGLTHEKYNELLAQKHPLTNVELI